MKFHEYRFEAMNEADVREEIVAPLIAHLGYRTSSEHDVIREQRLTYDRAQLGRRKARDQPLRGIADYICVAGGRVRWVIEAKPPGEPLDREAEAQAWSYANHPEVRAVYFALANGREFKLFMTSQGPESPPLLQCAYSELPAALLKIENTLRPESVLRDHPEIVVDPGEPLAPGLRSVARVTRGRIGISRITPELFGPIAQLVSPITDGTVERRHDGTLHVFYNVQSPVQSVHQANQLLGLSEVELFSPDHTISTNSEQPTRLFGGREVIIPKGMELLNILDWKTNVAATTMTATVSWYAHGFLTAHTFAGTYDSTMFLGGFGGPQIQISGSFEADLA